jgi:hypothetical protein
VYPFSHIAKPSATKSGQIPERNPAKLLNENQPNYRTASGCPPFCSEKHSSNLWVTQRNGVLNLWVTQRNGVLNLWVTQQNGVLNLWEMDFFCIFAIETLTKSA